MSNVDNESLNIDFADRDDIRAKLPAARRRLENMERVLAAQQQEVEDWRLFVQMLTRRVGQAGDGASELEVDIVSPTVKPLDLVVEVVNREMRKIRAKDVGVILRGEGHTISNSAVSNSLFYAANRLEPPRLIGANELGRGYYAPLGYSDDAAGHTTPAENPFMRDVDDAGAKGGS